jgi:uncharacterized protein YkwD
MSSPERAEPELRGSLAAAALTTALLDELVASQPQLTVSRPLARVAEAAAWSAAEEETISDLAVRNAMVSELRSAATPRLVAARLRFRDAPASRDRASRSARARDQAITRLTAPQLQELHDALVVALRELVAEVALESFAVSVRSGRAGIVAVVAALEPPRLPLRVERRGARAVVTAPWDYAAVPEAFLVSARDAQRVRSAVVKGAVRIEVPCRPGLADLEVVGAARLYASVVDVCSSDEPRWRSDVGELGPRAASVVEIEQRAFELLNRERRDHGLAALEWDATALAMARAHSRDMAAHHFVEHVGSDGATVAQRLARVRLPAYQTFENVGRAGGPGEMHHGFLTSPGHRANMLAANARRGAVAAVRDPGTGQLYFTQVLFEPARPPMRVLAAADRPAARRR